jgi:hypothetical protein
MVNSPSHGILSLLFQSTPSLKDLEGRLKERGFYVMGRRESVAFKRIF